MPPVPGIAVLPETVLVNKKSGRRVLGVLLVYNQARNQNLLQIAVPLGVMLQNGAVLGSDTYTSGVMHFRLCDMQGCYVVAPLDNDAVKAIGQATKAEVRIVSTEGKNFNITFSLNGFTAAYNALLDLTRQKSPAAPSTEQSLRRFSRRDRRTAIKPPGDLFVTICSSFVLR